MTPFRVFRRSEMFTECEACGVQMDLSRAGVCVRCRCVLCHDHLHGSFVRRLLVDLGAEPVCLRCRQS